MEEADRVANQIAIIDNGKIISQGSPQELKNQTQTSSLEDAFLALTGRTIREEEASPVDHLRMRRRMWRR
jgi:ABC-2 type transport system ATP-binding protein